MARPSISIPDALQAEIDDRRHSTTSRSEWIADACRGRIEDEDAGVWTEPEIELEPADDETAVSEA